MQWSQFFVVHLASSDSEKYVTSLADQTSGLHKKNWWILIEKIDALLNLFKSIHGSV